MQRTRREILNILKRKGKATLEELAQGVGLVPVTVRAHLNVLERDDLVKYEEVRGRVGRPYYVYTLTEEAEALFPKSYHSLANRILDGLSEIADDSLVVKLVDQMADDWARERAPRLEGKSFSEKVAEMAAIRTEEGAWAEVEETANGLSIVQYNCPCPRVASKHSSISCSAELTFIRKLLGPNVQRTEWNQAEGRACRYEVPRPESAEAPAPLLAETKTDK